MSHSYIEVPGTPGQQFVAGAMLLIGFLLAAAFAVALGIQGNWIGCGLLFVAAILLFIAGCATLVIASFNNYSASSEEDAEAAYDASFPPS